MTQILAIYKNNEINVQFRAFGNDFNSVLDCMHNSNGSFNKDTKDWSVDLANARLLKANLDDLKLEINCSVGFDPKIEDAYRQYRDSLNELKFSDKRLPWDQSLLKCLPLTGKHPNENFQQAAILRAIGQNRFLFDYTMGLGKSYCIAAIIEHLRKYKVADKVLILSLSIGIPNLLSELEKFTYDLNADTVKTVSSIASIDKNDRFFFDDSSCNTMLLSYSVLKSVIDAYHKRIYGNGKSGYKLTDKLLQPIKDWAGENAILILDECHAVNNQGSQQSKAVQAIAKFFNFRYLLSGTVADKYEKLYVPCKLLSKSLVNGMSYYQWLEKYNDVGNRFSRYAVNQNGWHLSEIKQLQENMKQYCDKKTLQECRDMPPLYVVPTVRVEMSKKQRAIYESFCFSEIERMQKEAVAAGKELQLTANIFQYLQIAVDNPELLKDNKNFDSWTDKTKSLVQSFNYEKDFNKLQILDEILEKHIDLQHEKGIVWCYHPKTIELLAKKYEKHHPYVADASLTFDERKKLCDDFQKDTDAYLLIASINVLNVSVSLTALQWECYYEATYNYTVYEQSTGRIRRATSVLPATMYSIRYNKSIDCLQEKNLRHKGELMNSWMTKKLEAAGDWSSIFSENSFD